MRHRGKLAVLAGALLLVAVACGGDDDDDSAAGDTAAATTAAATTLSAATTAAAPATAATEAPTTAAPATEAPVELTTLKLGAVPTLELGLLQVGTDQGFFAKAGVALEITNVDSGPNVVTGVVAGQYDLGYTAYAPPLLAVAGGQPLRVVSNTGSVGESGQNGGVLVKKDSGITRFADLAGKKVASNAPRSLLSLTVPAAVAADGGDGSTIEIVPLPFNEIAGAVESGQVDAGVTLEPFQTKALSQYPDLVDLGDSIALALPKGAPSGLLFTSADTAKAKADALAAFAGAFAQTVEYANAHLDEVRAAGAPLAGLDPTVAATLPLATFSTELTPAGLQPLVDLMLTFGWVDKAPDLAAFIGTGA